MNTPFATRSLRARIAWRVAKITCAPNKRGELKPSGGASKVFVDDNGQQLAIVQSGEGIDVFVGKKAFYQFAMSARLASRLACWLVWWWLFYTWCGLRLRLWNWALGVLFDEDRKAMEKHGTQSKTS